MNTYKDCQVWKLEFSNGIHKIHNCFLFPYVDKEIRLLTYIMVIFNFNYNDINRLNTFNNLSKTRYLPYINKIVKSSTNKLIRYVSSF